MVKPGREGSSTALHKVRSRSEIELSFKDAFVYDKRILVEEELKGMELTTLVYGFGEVVRALPPSQLLKGGDFLTAQEKFLPGGAQMITPPPVPAEVVAKIQEESIKAYKAIGLKIYSRIDSFLEGDYSLASTCKVIILEPNNPPAMTPSTALWLQAAEAGFNSSQFLDELINISLRAHREKLGPL
jgi:D-alanine-D-alanine ligase